jgi:uncharacterized membrane protein
MSGKTIALRVTGLVGWFAFLFFGGIVIYNSLDYFRFHASGVPPFFEEKAPASGHWAWRFAIYTHVTAGIICLAASVLQFFRGVLRRWPALHRWLGRTYAMSALWVLCPSGFYLSAFAFGGLPGRAGFFLLGVITFLTTWRGVAEMKAGRTRSHARWMIRSFAMITTAITFRLYHTAFGLAGWEYETNFLTALWLSVLGNAAAGEWFARMIPLPVIQHPRTPNHETEIHDPILGRAGYP